MLTPPARRARVTGGAWKTSPTHQSFRSFAAKEFPGFTSIYEGLGEAELRDDNPEEAAFNRRKFLALSAAALASLG